MDVYGTLVILFICIITFLIVVAVLRYAVDSSDTSKKLEVLIKEVHYLRSEIKRQNNREQDNKKHIIDEIV